MEEKIGIERVADLMGDCNTVNPATYCDISNTAPDKVSAHDNFYFDYNNYD